MKKTKLQAMIDFISQVHRVRSEKKDRTKGMGKSINGKLRLLLMLSLGIHSVCDAVTYYSRSNGFWNNNNTWSTSTYGSAVNSGSYPKAGDIANIGNGYTISISSNINCANINVGQGSSGTLQFLTMANYNAIVTGNVTVNTGGKIWYNSAVNRIHQFIIGGNFANYGTVDFYYAPGQYVNLFFNTSSNSNVTGNGSWDLNNVTMAKSVSTSAQLNVQSNAFEIAIRNFIGSYGTYIHNNSGAYSINPTTTTFTIGPNVIFKVPMGLMRFASNADNLVLQGSLYVSGGSVFVGTSAGLQGIRTDRSGVFTPYLEVTSGNLIVYGGITYGTSSAAEPASFQDDWRQPAFERRFDRHQQTGVLHQRRKREFLYDERWNDLHSKTEHTWNNDKRF